MSFVSLINFNPNDSDKPYDDEIETIGRVDINGFFINSFFETDLEDLILQESKNSKDEIVYKTINPSKTGELYKKVKSFYIDYLSKIGCKAEIDKEFNEIYSCTLMYSQLISLLKLAMEYNNNFIRLRVSY